MYETEPNGVRATGLGKRYGDLWALRDVDLHVPAGTVLGLLGHNGAGKTTAIRILTTLAAPTTGVATVAGHDVVGDPGAVRAAIGLAGQAATVDGLLTGRANLEMIGRLQHLGGAAARARADELLERFDLGDAADRLARDYSGGMRRRLDLAASIVHSPAVLFLDEPTTGLDPRSRTALWDLLRELVAGGVTLVLTTQYLEEADRLADDIVVLDHGRVAAHGTPAELKRRIGGARIAVTVAGDDALEPAAQALRAFGSVVREDLTLTVPAVPMMDVMRALDAAGVGVADVARREATLDEVFLSLTEKQEVLAA